MFQVRTRPLIQFNRRNCRFPRGCGGEPLRGNNHQPAGKDSDDKLVAVRKIDMELNVHNSRPGAERHSQFGESNRACPRTCLLPWRRSGRLPLISTASHEALSTGRNFKKAGSHQRAPKCKDATPGNEHQRDATWYRSAEVRDCLWHSTTQYALT